MTERQLELLQEAILFLLIGLLLATGIQLSLGEVGFQILGL